MQSIAYKNELVKRGFYKYLENAKRFSPKSIESYEKAIWLWEDFSKKADFKFFNQTKAEEFKDWLKNKQKKNSQELVSLSYCYDILRYLKVFFEWLSGQPNYRKINRTAIDYLNLTRGEAKIATQSKAKIYPSLEEVKAIIEGIDGKTEIEMRDKALISLMFLTGARISAILSLPMQSFDREKLTVYQDPKLGVQTKNSKLITTAIMEFSFYKEPRRYFLEWFDYLEKERKFKPNEPIFPATKIENGKDNIGYYNTEKVEPLFWKNTNSIRKIFEKRSKQVEIRCYKPHSFRDLLVKEISKLSLTEEQKKAFSQNLGHEDVGTTFGNYGYGKIGEDKQIEIMKSINFNSNEENKPTSNFSSDDIKSIARELKNELSKS